MARNSRNKKIYLIAITIYLFVVAISLLTCFLLEAPAYTYALIPLGIGIIFLVTFFISCYATLYRIDADDVDEIKKISTNIEASTLIDKLKLKGFEQLGGGQIFYKTQNDKKRKFKRYVYLAKSNSFDLGLEQFLKELQEVESVDKSEYFEAYIMMLSETTEYMAELYKENRAINYIFPNISFSIIDKLFKCLIYNEKESTLYYYKIRIYPQSLNAMDFIESEIAELFK